MCHVGQGSSPKGCGHSSAQASAVPLSADSSRDELENEMFVPQGGILRKELNQMKKLHTAYVFRAAH